jgi:NADH-quinone oxidoreductase subunit N
MAASVADLAPQIALLVGAGVVLLTAMFSPRGRQHWVLLPALVSLVTAGWLQAVRLGTETLTFDGRFALDDVTGWTTIMIVVVTGFTVLLAPAWLRSDPRAGEYHALLLFAALGASLLAGASELLELTAALLLAAVPGYVLAAYHRASPLATEAGMKYFLVGGLTNVGLLLGVVLLFGAAGTTEYTALSEVTDPALVIGGLALVAVGLAFEIGALPAHAWLPDVAQGAPAPSAAFLTVAPKLGALVALARLVAQLPAEVVGWRALIALLAATTMTLGNLAAFWQDDVRRLLGWSSVSQAGYGLMALVALGRSSTAIPALLYFVVAYALGNVAAFAVVTHLRGRTALADYAGLARRRPWVAAALTIALLSLTGIPPLVGFIAKLELFGAAIDAGYAWLAVLAVVNTVASLFYYLRVIAPMYLREPTGEVHVLSPTTGAVAAVAAAATLLVAAASGPLLDAFTTARLLP